MESDLKKRLSRIEDKIDKHQELLWHHITNDTKKFEQIESKLHGLSQEQKWFKRIATGVATVMGAVITWSLELRR